MRMMSYKYDPADFATLQSLSDDLTAFYHAVRIYAQDKSDTNWYALRHCWEVLFFTLKHRELEGGLTSVAANEIRDYLEELIEHA